MSSAVRDARAMIAERSADEVQLDMLDPVTAEDMLEARAALGEHAGTLSVLDEARRRRRGRPKGARNRRTDDFAKYIMGYGQHPAITLMQIQATPPEVLMEQSRQMDPAKRRMTLHEAQSLRIRCAEGLLPYIESKKPVAVDMSFHGVGDLIIEGVTHSGADFSDVVDADFMAVDDDDGDAA